MKPLVLSRVKIAGLFLCQLGVTCVFLAGCSSSQDAAVVGSLYPVKGQVLLPNGKPLDAGKVVFVSTNGTLSATGDVGSDGSFTLKSGESGEGAPAGDYKVRIEADPVKHVAGKRGAAALPFPSRYLDEDSSEITVTVKAEPNDLPPIKLSSTPDKTGRAGGRAAVRD